MTLVLTLLLIGSRRLTAKHGHVSPTSPHLSSQAEEARKASRSPRAPPPRRTRRDKGIKLLLKASTRPRIGSRGDHESSLLGRRNCS
ncbi:hypothetical protein V8C43DRAFT_277778 [Trichoderma afarasin]